MSADVDWSRPPEVLDGGEPRRPLNRVLVAVVGGAVALAVAVALLVPYADQRRRDHELTELTACVATGQQAVDYADASLRGMGQYIAAGLGSSDSASVRRSMFTLLQQAGSAGVPGLDAAVSQCRGVHVATGHHAVVAARASYLTWLTAKADFYRAVATDARVARATPPGEAQLLADARQALLAASSDEGRRRAFTSALSG